MSQLKKTIMNLLVVSLVVGAGYWAWQKYQASAQVRNTAEKPVSHAPSDTIRFSENAPQLAFLQVKLVEDYPEPLVEPLSGKLVYDDNHTARVFSPIAGRVLQINVDAGREVKAGDALLTLDAPDYAQATADVAKAKADLEHKRQTFERARGLLTSSGISIRELEAADADFRQAEAELQRAEARIHNLQSTSVLTNGKFVLRAPVAGIVSERQVNIGSEVRPDAPNPLFVISDSKKLWALIDLPERHLNKVRVGQAVTVEADAYPSEVFKGKVSVIGEALDPITRRIQVRAQIDNTAHRLKAEMFVRVTPSADSDATMPRVPNSALFTVGLNSYLFVEQAPGVLQRRKVVLGLQSHEYSYVQEGLKAGEHIVTAGALLLNSELAGND